MKSIKFVIVALFGCFTTNLAAQIVVFDQRFQVENMPQPKAFTQYNAFSIPGEQIETAAENYTYQKSYHRITGSPIPIANNEGLIISAGFGYATDRSAMNSSLVKNVNQAIWGQLYTTGSIGDGYYWRGAYAFGSYSDKLRTKNTSTYKHTLLAQFGRKWSDQLATSLGILILSNFSDVQYIPTLHVSYSTGSWVIDAVLPNEVNVRYLVNDNFHLLLFNSIARRSYYNPEIGLSNRFSINEIGIQTEIKLKGVLWFEISISKPYALALETQERDDYIEIGDIKQMASINGGLFIRFQGKK